MWIRLPLLAYGCLSSHNSIVVQGVKQSSLVNLSCPNEAFVRDRLHGIVCIWHGGISRIHLPSSLADIPVHMIIIQCHFKDTDRPRWFSDERVYTRIHYRRRRFTTTASINWSCMKRPVTLLPHLHTLLRSLLLSSLLHPRSVARQDGALLPLHSLLLPRLSRPLHHDHPLHLLTKKGKSRHLTTLPASRS